MNIVLSVFGAIFLTIILIFAMCSLSVFLWARRSVNRYLESDIKTTEYIDSSSLDFNPFADFPIFGRYLKKQFELMEDGIKYVNDSVPQILANWDCRELVTRATPKFLDSLEPGEPEGSFESHLDNLGKLKVYKGLRQVKDGIYLAEASFDKGLAQIKVQLFKEDDKWLINYFKIYYLFQLNS